MAADDTPLHQTCHGLTTHRTITHTDFAFHAITRCFPQIYVTVAQFRPRTQRTGQFKRHIRPGTLHDHGIHRVFHDVIRQFWQSETPQQIDVRHVNMRHTSMGDGQRVVQSLKQRLILVFAGQTLVRLCTNATDDDFPDNDVMQGIATIEKFP